MNLPSLVAPKYSPSLWSTRVPVFTQNHTIGFGIGDLGG